MNIPQISNIDTAISIYYHYPELSTKEISRLFNKNSKSTINRLKKVAKQQMIKENVCSYGMYKVNTKCAYKSWGIDIEDLEKRRNKLQKLGL